MRIAIASPVVGHGDGQGRVNFEIAMLAAEQGHKVTILANRVDDALRNDSRFRVVTWNVRRIPTHLLRSLYSSFMVGRWLRKHRHSIDVLHGNGGFTRASSEVNAVHFVHSSWQKTAMHPSRTRKGLASLYYRLLTMYDVREEKIAFRGVSRFIAVSELVKKDLIVSGIDASKIRVIQNGVNPAEFMPGASKRRELGLPLDQRLVLFAGDMKTPRKNLDGILKAVVPLEGVHVVVVGSLLRNPYPALAAELGISDRVHFLGFRTDVAEIMRSVDLFVFPSRYEACSLVMLEALSSGLPVVTAATAGGAEIVEEAGGIVLEDPERVDLISKAIEKILSNEGRRLNLSARARSTAESRSWTAMAFKYLESYAEQYARGMSGH